MKFLSLGETSFGFHSSILDDTRIRFKENDQNSSESEASNSPRETSKSDKYKKKNTTLIIFECRLLDGNSLNQIFSLLIWALNGSSGNIISFVIN